MLRPRMALDELRAKVGGLALLHHRRSSRGSYRFQSRWVVVDAWRENVSQELEQIPLPLLLPRNLERSRLDSLAWVASQRWASAFE